MTTAPPKSIRAALLVAQQLLPGVLKDSKNDFHKYKYVSSESMIREARAALHGAGLALSPTRAEVITSDALVALGVPRQETWIQRLHPGQPGLWMGVGGSFDVWSGVKQRAPQWMSRLQIEWLYRLVQEPSRWRRMLALPAFAWAVLRTR